MAEDAGDKSQDATPHRRQQAREQGQIAKSQELASAVILLAGATALLWLGKRLVEAFYSLAQTQWGGDAWLDVDERFAVTAWQETLLSIGPFLLSVLGVVVVAAVTVEF